MEVLQPSTDGDIVQVPRCEACGSERVVRYAWASWNTEFGRWEVESVFDQTRCQFCNAETTLIWCPPEQPATQRIRELNDRFRCHGLGSGSVVVTSSRVVSSAIAGKQHISHVFRARCDLLHHMRHWDPKGPHLSFLSFHAISWNSPDEVANLVRSGTTAGLHACHAEHDPSQSPVRRVVGSEDAEEFRHVLPRG